MEKETNRRICQNLWRGDWQARKSNRKGCRNQ